MTAHIEIEQFIARWQDRGLLADGQAQVLLDDVHDTEYTPERGGRLLDVAVTAGLEALGYLGAALAVGAIAYLSDVADWPTPALLVLLAAIASVAVVAVHRLAPATEGAASRLLTVVGSAGLAATYGFMAVLFDPSCSGSASCGWAGERLMPLVFVAPGLALAAWLHGKEANAVTHAWLGGSVAAGVFLLSQAFVPLGSSTRHEEVAAAVFLLPASIAWIWATETGRIAPAWIGTFGAGWVAGMMLLMLADLDILGMTRSASPPLALLAHGFGFVAAGVTWKRWRLTLVGALALVWAVPWTLTEVFDLSGQTTAMLLLPLGLLLLAYVVRQLRTAR